MIKFLLGVLCCSAVWAAPAAKPTCGNSYFSAPSAGWVSAEVSEDAALGVYTVELVSPKASQLSPAVIYLSYYAPGNSVYSGSAQFLKGLTGSMVGAKGASVKAPVPVKAGKYAATAIESEQVRFVPPDSPAAKEVSVKEKQLLVDDSSGKGFYVLHLFSAAKTYKDNLKVFNKVSAGFVKYK